MADRHLSEVETLMWALDADPHLSSTFANVTLFDRPADLDRFRDRMTDALVAVPRLRRHVEDGLGGPRWVDDDEVDLDRHVRRVDLDPPGSERALLDLAVEVAATPFDRTRPLWEFVVVDGLEGGRGAMVQKLHHTITDGVGGIRMSEQFIDLERDPGPRPAPTAPPEDPSEPAEPPSGVEALADALSELTRTPRDLARQAVEGTVGLVGDPGRLTELPGDAAATVRSLVRQLGVTGSALSPLWRERTLGRRLELLAVPLEDARAAATALGGSVNDLFVAGAAGGAGEYHRRCGAPVDELRMAMPVSTRAKGGPRAGGNAFAPTRVRVPTTADPRARLAEVSARLGVTKEERAVGLAGAVAGLGTLLPGPVLTRLVRQQASTVDFTTSNLRGAPFPLYIAGARIQGNHPIGPLAGTAWNLTTISVDGSLDMGLHLDTGAVDEPELLRTCIEEAFAELLDQV